MAMSLIGGVALASAQTCPTSPSPNYSPDFSANQNCLALNSSTATMPAFATAQTSTAQVLRLTPATNGLATSAWFATPQNVAAGFSTTFSFQIGQPNPYHADGIAFVIQNSGKTALGPGGCGMGYGGDTLAPVNGCAPATAGIPSSVAIAFNTYDNGTPIDPNSNDVAIQSCPNGAPNSVDVGSNCSVTHAIVPGSFTNDSVYTVTVTYTPSASSTCGVGGSQSCSSLDVVVNGSDLFPGGVLFDMTTVTAGTAFVGFTAGTGGGSDVQDIVNWTFTPTQTTSTPTQTQTGTVAPNQSTPTTFNYSGGFAINDPTSGYNFSAQQNLQTPNPQTVQMVVTAIPISQSACNALVQKNTSFAGAKCFVYQNGGGQGIDSAVLFEVTCPATGSCGTPTNAFFADLGSQFSFDCANNPNLDCPASTATSGGSFGLPHLTNIDSLPAVGFLKGEGPPNSQHPCTSFSDGVTPLFTSNQIETFKLGDTSGGAKGGSGGTTSCWTMTYHTPGETPSVTVTQPTSGPYLQNLNDATTTASYTCAAVSNGDPNTLSVGPYLTLDPNLGGVCAATNSVGGAVANGAHFDTATPGAHTFTAQVQDSAMNTNQTTVNYTVVAPPGISGPTSATFSVGSPGSVVFSATGFPTPAFHESGALPTGVAFVDNGNGTATLSGTPTVNGIFPVTITAQNTYGAPTLAFTLTTTATVPAAGKCNGVYNGIFKGNLTISAGQSCTFIGGGVTGNVTETGGSFVATHAALGGNVVVTGGTFSVGPAVTVKGNFSVVIPGKSSIQSQVCGATIGGNLQVLGSGTPVTIGSSSASCPGNTISGTVTVSANLAATAISNNTIGGNLLDLANLKPTQVFSNHVHGILNCQADASITGGGNTAASKQGQCARF